MSGRWVLLGRGCNGYVFLALGLKGLEVGEGEGGGGRGHLSR